MQEVKTYRKLKEFEKDQPKMAAKGYEIASITDARGFKYKFVKGVGLTAIGGALVGVIAAPLLLLGISKKGKLIVVYEKRIIDWKPGRRA